MLLYGLAVPSKPGILAVTFVPAVFLPKHRSGFWSWGKKSDLDFPAVPRLWATAFMKNYSQMCRRCLRVPHEFIFLEVFSGFIMHQDKAQMCLPAAPPLLLRTWTLFLTTSLTEALGLG